MNLLSIITRSALTGLAVLGFASSAVAHHVPKQPFIQAESNLLLEAVVKTGHRVEIDPDICRKRKNLFGAAVPADKVLIICTEPHKGDDAELADTIRHETIHLAQFCKGRKYGATSALINPRFILDYSRLAEQYLHMPTSLYTVDKIPGEAEARVLAHHLDEYQVAQLLVEQCS